MELAPAGTLNDLIRSRKLNDNECSCIMRQILCGIAYIHKKDIIHRDIKPQNILMVSFKSLEDSVKITDFGLVTQGTYLPADTCGTPTYMAPEKLNNLGYGKVFYI